MDKSSESDVLSQKNKSFDYAWEFDSGVEVSINNEKYRNVLVDIYFSKPDSLNSSLVVKKGKDSLHYL